VADVITALHAAFTLAVLPAPYDEHTVPEFTWLVKVSVPVPTVAPLFPVVA